MLRLCLCQSRCSNAFASVDYASICHCRCRLTSVVHGAISLEDLLAVTSTPYTRPRSPQVSQSMLAPLLVGCHPCNGILFSCPCLPPLDRQRNALVREQAYTSFPTVSENAALFPVGHARPGMRRRCRWCAIYPAASRGSRCPGSRPTGLAAGGCWAASHDERIMQVLCFVAARVSKIIDRVSPSMGLVFR